MGRLNKSVKQGTLKNAFSQMVFVMTLLVVAASVITIDLCTAVKNWLVPITDEVMLHTYTQTETGGSPSSIRLRANGEKFEVPLFYVASDDEDPHPYNPVITHYAIEPVASFSFLSPRRKLLYEMMSVCTLVMPVLYAVAGILICSRLFYQKRLARPLAVLSEGAQKIANNDLDFTMTTSLPDELGKLCRSFEKMRVELLESQRAMWAVMEERRQLNASVAHDLRTPITIIEGYTEYLQRNIQSGRIDEAKLLQILENLSASAARLQRYVNSVQDIQSLDELQPDKVILQAGSVFEEVRENFGVLASRAEKELVMKTDVKADEPLFLDKQLFLRILENTISNALRYARKKVDVHIALQDRLLLVTITDDGAGFSEESLRTACTPFYKETGNEHLGIGLSISSILCKKHGGTLTVGNSQSGGGQVTFELWVKN